MKWMAKYGIILVTLGGSFGPWEKKRFIDAETLNDAQKKAEAIRLAHDAQPNIGPSESGRQYWSLLSVEPSTGT